MVGRAGWVSWQQLGEMVRDGMGVGSHTMSHANLSQLSRHEVREELAGSRKLLEDTLGTQVKYLSLPGGYRGSALGPLAAEAGYDGICCSMFGYNKFPADRYGLKRFCMRGSDSMEIVRRIMRAELIPLLPRFLRERGRNLCKRLIGERIYGALRAMLIPRGVHATLPRFPPE
jgi:peptidoglycan/xylan/chitin deacetylase (PgdA/CDA1 family)